jgi:adenylate cyclase
MAAEAVDRRLAAILSADAVGFSRLMSADDEATIRTVRAHQRRIEQLVGMFRGRVVDSPGDNLLAEFPSAVASVRCAIEIQRVLGAENEKLGEDRCMPFRLGIHLGDVIDEAGRIYGDGVNIAARLQALAEPGGLCVSDAVFQQVRRRLELPVADLGERELKNIDGPVRAYAIGRTPEPVAAMVARVAPPAALSAPAGPSLAVLPFVNMSESLGDEYFSHGLTTDIMESLVRLRGLFLISQDSMFTFKGTAATPLEVAREVGVRHVLEGSVRRAERRVRVSARLVEAGTGRYVWAERYDRDLDDVLAVQDDIASRVVTELDVRLVGGEEARLIRHQLRGGDALALLYRGLELLHRFTRDDTAQARGLFEEVASMEPDSPIPHGEVAWTHYFDVERGWSEDPLASLERMSASSERALERGDFTGFAHMMLGHLELLRGEHDRALELADRALDSRPGCQGVWSLKANILNYSGRPEEAIPFALRAVRMSPVSPPFYPEVLATARYLSGGFEAAIAAALETLALAPDSVDARVVLLASYVATGRLDAAREVAREILSIDPAFTRARFVASQPYREASVLARLDDALREAGIAEGGGVRRLPLAAPHAAAAPRRVLLRPRRS